MLFGGKKWWPSWVIPQYRNWFNQDVDYIHPAPPCMATIINHKLADHNHQPWCYFFFSFYSKTSNRKVAMIKTVILFALYQWHHMPYPPKENSFTHTGRKGLKLVQLNFEICIICRAMGYDIPGLLSGCLVCLVVLVLAQRKKYRPSAIKGQGRIFFWFFLPQSSLPHSDRLRCYSLKGIYLFSRIVPIFWADRGRAPLHNIYSHKTFALGCKILT